MKHHSLRSLVVLAVVASLTQSNAEILYAETATITFEEWIANLDPGVTLSPTSIQGRGCYCKNTTALGGDDIPQGHASLGQQPSASNFEFIFTNIPPLYTQGQPESSFDYVYLHENSA